MAGALNQDNEAYSHFNDGVDARHAPMSAVDKKMLNFAIKLAQQPATKAHGQILNHFGMYPPEFWLRAQRLTGHPNISKRQKAKLDEVFPDPSRPGPMSGGAPIDTSQNKFSHGLEW